ncbi:polymorphic toxin-type HINT domain-containing protein, partial [Paenibacillus apiarius]
ETGELGYNPVEELFQRETDETYHVKVNGTTIITTAEHPFWVAGEGWVEARDLKEGDKLVDLDDQEVPIDDIDVKKERITVYNFRVQGIHNYFVTDLKIWTHNCGGRDGALSGGRMSSSISAPRVGGGGGYSRPANVGRGPAGAKIEIPKNAEQFYKSVLDKGLKSNKGTGKPLSTSQLGLKDGMKMKTNDVLENAEKFLGQGYKDMGNGRFVSADGTRVVRMGDSDILGKHGGGPHMNFETLVPNPSKPGKMKVNQNLHIYLED